MVVLAGVAVAGFAQIPEVVGTPVDVFTYRTIDVKHGDGPEAKAGQKYNVHYTGWLRDGTKFDSSVDRKEPFEFVQGRRNVIAGWEAGFAGMKVGGRRRLIIPWQMAYGEKGSGPIPAKADLIFDVELLGVTDVPAQPAGLDLILPLKELRSKIVQLAKAMPEEKYGWRPAPNVRSFSEVMMHIALGNRLMFDIATNGLAGDALKKRITDNQAEQVAKRGKDEIIRRLDDSFDEVFKYLDAARAGTLATDMQFFDIAGNRRTIFVFLGTHVAEHLGQGIAYARMNGVNPPWSAR